MGTDCSSDLRSFLFPFEFDFMKNLIHINIGLSMAKKFNKAFSIQMIC